MYRTILTATLAALWVIAFDVAPASVSTSIAPSLSGSVHARGTTVKSSKSNTSDRKGKKPGTPPTGTPGGRGY
jgi:hypothetical protein